MVPGGGLEFGGEQPVLGPFSQSRAEYMAELYHDGQLELTPGESLIICAGSHQTLPLGVDEPPRALREGSLIADFLRRTGVPASLIETEVESTSTLTNAARTLDIVGRGVLAGEAGIDIVSHASHAKRVGLAFQRLGVARRSIGYHPLPESTSTRIYEAGMRSIFRVGTVGAHTEKQLVARDHIMERGHDLIASAPALAKKLLHRS